MTSIAFKPGEMYGPMTEPDAREVCYPCGTELYLNDKVLDRLGFEDMSELNIGQEVMIMAKAVITKLDAPMNYDGDCISLQIVDMDLRAGEKKSAAAVLYPEGDEDGDE